MSATPHTRSTPGAGAVLRSLFAILILVPVGALFLPSWESTQDDLSVVSAERSGVTYLRSLNQLTMALTAAQSAVVAGQSPSADALNRAVSEVAKANERHGKELRTHERWSGLRAKIEALPSQPLDGPRAAYNAYVEVTDLLLDLYGKVRESSGLIRDPGADSYFLQQGAAEDLPEVVVAAGRLTDLVVLASRQPAGERMQTVAELVAAQNAVSDATGDLTADLRAAVDGTQSRTLTQGLLGLLDAFQRGVEQLPAGPALLNLGQLAAQAEAVTGAANNVRDAATNLADAILAGLDALIVDRADGVRRSQYIAIGATALAVLLVVAAMIVRQGRRRSSELRRVAVPPSDKQAAPRHGAETAAPPGGYGPGPVGGSRAAATTPYGVLPDTNNTMSGWERSGAPR
jgi:hypothetical protein